MSDSPVSLQVSTKACSRLSSNSNSSQGKTTPWQMEPNNPSCPRCCRPSLPGRRHTEAVLYTSCCGGLTASIAQL